MPSKRAWPDWITVSKRIIFCKRIAYAKCAAPSLSSREQVWLVRRSWREWRGLHARIAARAWKMPIWADFSLLRASAGALTLAFAPAGAASKITCAKIIIHRAKAINLLRSSARGAGDLALKPFMQQHRQQSSQTGSIHGHCSQDHRW